MRDSSSGNDEDSYNSLERTILILKTFSEIVLSPPCMFTSLTRLENIGQNNNFPKYFVSLQAIETRYLAVKCSLPGAED